MSFNSAWLNFSVLCFHHFNFITNQNNFFVCILFRDIKFGISLYNIDVRWNFISLIFRVFSESGLNVVVFVFLLLKGFYLLLYLFFFFFRVQKKSTILLIGKINFVKDINNLHNARLNFWFFGCKILILTNQIRFRR